MTRDEKLAQERRDWQGVVDGERYEIAVLKAQVAVLTKERDEARACHDMEFEMRHLAEAHLAAARSEADALRYALQNLMGWQNGPPLVTYTKGWTEAMERARALLATKETP